MNRAFTHDPTTFRYEVMTKSNIGWRPYWILRLWRPQWAPALAPSKNEFSMFWSTTVSNFLLVDKCAQYHPNCSLSSSTITCGLHDESRPLIGCILSRDQLVRNVRNVWA